MVEAQRIPQHEVDPLSRKDPDKSQESFRYHKKSLHAETESSYFREQDQERVFDESAFKEDPFGYMLDRISYLRNFKTSGAMSDSEYSHERDVMTKNILNAAENNLSQEQAEQLRKDLFLAMGFEWLIERQLENKTHGYPRQDREKMFDSPHVLSAEWQQEMSLFLIQGGDRENPEEALKLIQHLTLTSLEFYQTKKYEFDAIMNGVKGPRGCHDYFASRRYETIFPDPRLDAIGEIDFFIAKKGPHGLDDKVIEALQNVHSTAKGKELPPEIKKAAIAIQLKVNSKLTTPSATFVRPKGFDANKVDPEIMNFGNNCQSLGVTGIFLEIPSGGMEKSGRFKPLLVNDLDRVIFGKGRKKR